MSFQVEYMKRSVAMLNSAHEESKATNMMKRQISLPRMTHVPASRKSMQVHELLVGKMKQDYSLD